VFFHPDSKDTTITKIVKNLNIDFTEYNKIDKLDELRKYLKLYYGKFEQNIDSIYNFAAFTDTGYLGSDIFNFFKEDVKHKCIKENYSNYLIVFTDGYMYYYDRLMNTNNRYNYIERWADHLLVFRKNNNWEKEFENNDYGFISINENFDSLNVLVLGIDPQEKEDFSILKKYWSKWFKEMKIKNYEFYESSDVTYIKDLINNFLNKK